MSVLQSDVLFLILQDLLLVGELGLEEVLFVVLVEGCRDLVEFGVF